MASPKEALLEPISRQIEAVETPVGTCHVRGLTVGEKDAMDVLTRRNKEGKPENFRVQVLIACCCDERGEPLFDEFDEGKIERQPARYFEPLLAAAIRVNGWGPEEEEALRKN